MRIIKRIIKFFLKIFIIFCFCNVSLYVYCLISPKIDINRNQSYYLYDDNDNLIFNNYSWVSLENISPYIIDATISTEDKHFYQHFGFDYIRICKAIINNISSNSLSEGASTITQQYARNMYLNYDKTWSRKINEAILALRLEAHYSKNEILEGYLNTINYGGVFGIENAAKYYFNKSAKDINLAEAAILAGIPQSPSNYSPFVNYDLSKKRQKIVLNLMYENGKISKNLVDQTYNYEIILNTGDNNNSISSGRLYFKDAVLSELNKIENIPSSILQTGGIKIFTTMNSEAQDILEFAVKKNIKNELQVASIMMNPKNGAVLALIGGKDYNSSQFNRAISAKRQVGSTMKPFLYYSALENGFTSASSFISEKTTFNLSNKKTYSPKNYNDKYANGPLSMGAAIAYSDNVYAVKTHLFLGENNLVSFANRLGIKNKLDAVPSLALGTEEIELNNMITAYSSFANGGKKVNSHFIRKITDSNNNILFEYNEENNVILNESLVFILNEMLTYTYDTAFIDYNYPTLVSLLPKITHRYSIKSGTTDTDMWIMGYNKEVVLGVWTGYDDNRVVTNDDSHIHKDIWIYTMEEYLKNRKCEWYTVPGNVVGVLVNPITGEIADKNIKNSKLFYFLKGTEPTKDDIYDLDSVFKESESNIDKKKN